jgi:hypothetical protein
MSAFALARKRSSCNLYSQILTTANLLVVSCLGYLTAIRRDGFYFPVEIDFEGKRRGVEHGSAIGAVTQVMLNIASYFRGEPTFEILAD